MGKQICDFCKKEREGDIYVYEFPKLKSLISKGKTETKVSGIETISKTPMREYSIPNYQVSAFICHSCISKDNRGDTRRRFLWFWSFWLFLIFAMFGIAVSVFLGDTSSSDKKIGLAIIAVVVFFLGTWSGIVILGRMNKKANIKVGSRGIDMVKNRLNTLFIKRRENRQCDVCGKPAVYYLKYQGQKTDILDPIFQGFRCYEHKQVGFLSRIIEPTSLPDSHNFNLCMGCGDQFNKDLLKCPRCKTKTGKVPYYYFSIHSD